MYSNRLLLTVTFYKVRIRPVIEYASHKRRAGGLRLASLDTPLDWRQSRTVFLDISNSPDHKLYGGGMNKCSFNTN